MNENTNGQLPNPEPDWSLLMFWEDITDLIQKIGELIESLFKSIFG